MAEQNQATALPPKNGNITVRLSRPIYHGDDEITELTLRSPTLDDLADIGYPFSISTGEETTMEMKPKTILKYASRLAGLPPSVVKTMSFADFMVVQTEIMGFFGDMGATPPT